MITEKILKELGFKRHPSLKIPEYWDLWLSTNTYNEKEHKFNRVLYIHIDFYDTDNSWYASKENYIKDWEERQKIRECKQVKILKMLNFML